MRKQKFHHILATLRDDLHWLPVCQRIVYKICTIVYKCVHGTVPSHLAEMCTPVAASTGRPNLHSATHGDLMVPRMRTITYGPRSFAFCWPCVWNDLPPILCESPGKSRQFQSTLKTTTLCCSAYRTSFGAFVTVLAIRTAWYKFTYYLLAYLLTCQQAVMLFAGEDNFMFGALAMCHSVMVHNTWCMPVGSRPVRGKRTPPTALLLGTRYTSPFI